MVLQSLRFGSLLYGVGLSDPDASRVHGLSSQQAALQCLQAGVASAQSEAHISHSFISFRAATAPQSCIVRLSM